MRSLRDHKTKLSIAAWHNVYTDRCEVFFLLFLNFIAQNNNTQQYTYINMNQHAGIKESNQIIKVNEYTNQKTYHNLSSPNIIYI